MAHAIIQALLGRAALPKLASWLGRVWLFGLALRLDTGQSPKAAESAHGADEARSGGKRYLSRGQSRYGRTLGGDGSHEYGRFLSIGLPALEVPVPA